MSYDTIKAGIVQAIETIVGFKNVLTYEPQSPQLSPFVYVVLDSYRRPPSAAQVTTMEYRFLARAANPIQNSKEAEEQLISLAMQIAQAIDTDPQLSGAVSRGIANSPDGITGWIPIGGTPCRVVDCYIVVMDKFPYAGAITGG